MEVGLAPRDLRYRFHWNAPIRVSPHDPKALYHCSQYVHRSTDEGQSWKTVISPDLSRNQKDKQDYAGRRRSPYENTGVEVTTQHLRVRGVACRRRASSGPAATTGWCTSRGTTARAGRTSRRRACPSGRASSRSSPSPHDPGRVFVAAHRLPAGRLPAVDLRHRRLRQDLEAPDRRAATASPRHAHARRPRGSATAGASSTPARSAGCTSRSTTARAGRACS